YAYDESNLKVTITEPNDKIEVNFDVHGNPVNLNDQEGNNITTAFESGNFMGRSYSFNNEQRLMLLSSNHNHQPDNSGLISLLLSQLRNTAFASFNQNTNLSFMEDGVMRSASNHHRSTRISRNLPVNFVDCSNTNRLVYNFLNTFPQFSFLNQNISFWFRVPGVTGRNVLFASGNNDSYLEVFNEGMQVSLRIGRNSQPLLTLNGLTANTWNYLGLSWRSDGRYSLTLNRQEAFDNGPVFHSNRVLNFGNNPLGSNSHNVAITHIVTNVDTIDSGLESIREVYNLTRGIFVQSRGLAGVFSGESAVTHLLERPDLLNQYQVFPLNGTLKSMSGVEPFRVSRNTENFIYDFELNRHVFLAYGGELEYLLPVRSNGGSVALKVLIEESSGEQTLLVLQSSQVIQFYRNAANNLGIRVGTTERLSDLVVSNNVWHNISLSWNQNSFTINLNNQVAEITNFAFNAFDNLRITVGSNRTIPGETNTLMGRIGGLYVSSPTAELVSGSNLNQIFRETKKRTRFDILGLPILEEVFEDTETALTKILTYQSDNGRANGLVTNERLTYLGNGRMNFDYTYDILGNVRTIKGEVNRNTNRIDSEFSYDHRNFLTREVNVNSDIEYTYDNNGNILSAVNSRNGQTKRFEYNNRTSNDLLTNYSDHEKDIVFTYDEKYIGNPKTKVVRNKALNVISNLEYQFEGRRLTNIVDKENGEKLTFRYNSQGLRISKECQKVVDNGVAYEVKYYYDGDRLITERRADYRLDFHYDNSGLLFAFTHTVGSMRIKYYYLRDILLNIVGITGPNGLVAEYQYQNAYGSHQILNADGSVNNDLTSLAHLNPMRFKGYYWDQSCQMYYLQSRFYDSEICRFISA
ncbi:MAG: hypothetical protein FWE36_08960, partial [Erysipelotrichales bacterium]|nr:hypothetical protein [Erysipelotrichales bacterium]